MNFFKECLSEPEGKTSIKRVMLIIWFFLLVGLAIFSEITWIQFYVFLILLSQKAVEEISKNASIRK